MATNRWLGRALPVAQVDTLVLGGTWATGDTITLAMNGKPIVITIGPTTTLTAVTEAVYEVWSGAASTGDYAASEVGSDVPEFAEVTALVTAVGSTVTLTANTKGYPFTVTATKTSTSGTLAHNSVTAATGPNHWTDVNNWYTGAVPVTGDTVHVDNSAVDILFGIAQSAVTLAALYIDSTFTATIGLPERNGNNYEEYRPTYLAIGATVLQIGSGNGGGSGRIKIDTGAAQTALAVYGSGSALDPNMSAIVWKGTHAANALVQTNGDLGVAVFGNEVATLATVTKSGGSLECSAGVTLSGALTQNNGDLTLNSAVATSYTQTGGSAVINGSGAVAQLTVRGGPVVYNTTGTLGGTPTASGSGSIDFTQNPSPKTVSGHFGLYGTACLVDDSNKVLGSVVVNFFEDADPSQFRFGPNSQLTRGAVG